MAKGCKIKAQTVSNWIMRKSIPIRHWSKLLEMGVSKEELLNAHLNSESENAAQPV